MKNIDYNPSKAELKKIEFVYDNFKDMRKVSEAGYKECNYSESKERDRTITEFIDDNQKRMNSYVPSKDSQDKEDWQANIFTQYTRNKVKAHLASVAKKVPDIRITATNEKSQISVERGETMKHLVRASYVEDENNPEVVLFFDAWDCIINGTVITYDGYLKTKDKIKIIKSYDYYTGEIEIEEREEFIEDKAIEISVPLTNFYIWDPYIRDIQKQPKVIWTQYYDKDEFDYEFGNYKNNNFVMPGIDITSGQMALFFGEQWQDRIDKDKIEVIRYYSKADNSYRIVANGVLILDTPLLWGKKRKKYPFAKTIYEPFANTNFFWGNSLPNILMGSQDVANAFINSMVDKTYRTLVPAMLIGNVNRDAFELEDETITGDTKIYVNDISQVTPMPFPSVNAAEMKMLELISRGIDEASTDPLQSGYSATGSTAREIVLANERAEELKGLFFTMIKDLWLQKNRLRILSILMNYNKKKVNILIGEEGEQIFEEQFRAYTIPNERLSRNEIGIQQIKIAEPEEIMEKNRIKGYQQIEGKPRPFNEVDIEEEEARLRGYATEITYIPSDYLDDWNYSIEIETEAFYQSSRALDKALTMEKIEFVARIFPDIFIANKIEFFKDLIEHYKDNPEKYLKNLGQGTMEQALAGLGGEAGMPTEREGMALPEQIARPTATLPKLTGVEA